jgi:predicted DNA-binding transcriptional regulator AlpA
MERSFEQREIITNMAEVARTLGLSQALLYRYKRYFPDFPSLPTFKSAVRGWAERRRLPRRRGSQPSFQRKQVVYMRGEPGMSFRRLPGNWESACKLWTSSGSGMGWLGRGVAVLDNRGAFVRF